MNSQTFLHNNRNFILITKSCDLFELTIFARDCIMSKIQLRNLMISIEKAILEMVKVKPIKFKFILNGRFSCKMRKLGYLSINITIWRDFLGLLWKDKICATQIYHFSNMNDLFIESMAMNFPLFRSSLRTWSQELDSIHPVDEFSRDFGSQRIQIAIDLYVHCITSNAITILKWIFNTDYCKTFHCKSCRWNRFYDRSSMIRLIIDSAKQQFLKSCFILDGWKSLNRYCEIFNHPKWNWESVFKTW